jgi:hypothetical protein
MTHESKSRPSKAAKDRQHSPLDDSHGGTQCEVCGNHYDKPLEIVQNGISHYFDSFECAISALAPKCAHCQCRIIGHGVEAGGQFFCCAHCATQVGVSSLKDRA